MATFLTVLPRAVFRTQLKVYHAAFFQKNCLYYHKMQIILYCFTYFNIILYDFISCPAFVDINQTLH